MIAGAGGFVVQILAVALLLHLELHYLVATVMAVEAAIIVNFFVHEHWTFRDRGGAAAATMLERLIRYHVLVSLTSVLGSILLSAYFVEATGLHPVAANVASIVVLSAINFIGADRLVFRAGMVVAATLGVAGGAYAGGDVILQPKTAREFARYAATVEARRAQELASNAPFLDIERKAPADLAHAIAALKRGEVVVSKAAVRDGSSSEFALDGGLINHWRGTVFVPKVKLDHLLKVLQDPQSNQHKQEDVVSSRVVPRGPDTQKLYLRIKRTKLVTVVYDTEYDVEYKRLAADRALSNSVSTKIVEIENAGTSRERALPEGNDNGYMWRLNSYWRYKQYEDGVLVEVESLSLSRDLPAIIGPLIRPIVTSTASESITRTLAAVRGRFRARADS
ncbi:MAG TPA: GtrA family protein [Vicinamibacterales bacterium]|nr:GtrA family protein [Vicinamibacterales bacterium]